MAFAQLSYRESLRDIEACLAAQQGKLYHMGIGGPVACSTLADANEQRDWRIYADLAQMLIRIARPLYVDDSFGIDLEQSVYALDATTIDLCLSLFPWAHACRTKAAVKLHTLLDLRGNIPTFIHISDGKLSDVKALDLLVPEPGAFYIMDRGYFDFARLYRFQLARRSFSSAPSPIPKCVASTRVRSTNPPDCDATKPFGQPANTPRAGIRSNCAASSTTTRKPTRPSSS